MEKFNEVKQLKYVIQTILPQVYTDALSNQELLNKLVAKLNEIITTTNKIPDFIKALIEEYITGGAIGEVINDILAGYFLSVKNPPNNIQPAVGDGSADDTLAIQECIDYAHNLGGGIVYFPSGAYLTQSLTLKSGVSLCGFANTSTKLVLKGGTLKPLISGTTYDNTISNLTLDGNMTIQVEDIDVVVLEGGKYVLQNLVIKDGYNLMTLTLNEFCIASGIRFGRGVVDAFTTKGTGKCLLESLVFEGLSNLDGRYAINNSIPNAVFTGIYSVVNTTTVINNTGNNCYFEGQILNGINPIQDTSALTDYDFYSRGSTLKKMIADEKRERLDEDELIREEIADEVALRITADEAINLRIDDLLVNLADEIANRVDGDNLLDSKISTINTKIGDLSGLDTDTKNNLVGAINDANGKNYFPINYKIYNPYKFGGNLKLKGQLHCHTTNSDGLNAPLEVVNAYKNAGYDFIAITDHNVITNSPDVPDITFIQSIEESYDLHITAYDVNTMTQAINGQDIINFEVSQGKMCSIAHPNWSERIIPPHEFVGYYDYNFTEIYNSLMAHYAPPTEKQVDAGLSCGNKFFLLATDDCHNVNNPSMFNRGWVVVNCNANTKSEILYNLQIGNFYASTGNDLNVNLTGNIVNAKCTEPSNIQFIGMNGKVLQSHNNVTNASYFIRGNEMYVRIRATKVSDGTMAWSQPIMVNILGGDSRRRVKQIRNSNLMGIERQAIINPEFKINQRGIDTETTTAGYPTGYMIDGWFNNSVTSDIHPPTVTRSREKLAYPYNKFSQYAYKVSWSGEDSGNYTTTAEYGTYQRIENGVKLLCTGEKKLSLSFYARSEKGKKIAIVAKQRYGTGGEPSASDDTLIAIVDITQAYRYYSFTWNPTTIRGKVFGTDNNDYLQIGFYYMWNDTPLLTPNEKFGVANSVEIAQVQVCSGDFALPYCPRHNSQEVEMCRRYLRVGGVANHLYMADGDEVAVEADFYGMRVIPNVKTNSNWHLHNLAGDISIDIPSGTSFTNVYSSGGIIREVGIGITEGTIYQINSSAQPNNRISAPASYIASAEL